MAKDPKMEMMMHHKKHKSCMLIVVGILIILNAVYGWFSWALFVGGVFVLVGVIDKILLATCCKKK